jgi:hypothetical protein
MAGKALCISGMVVAGLVLVLFLTDLLFGMIGLQMLQPFKFSSWLMDIAFIILAAGLGFLSWSAWKELI